MLSGNSIQKLGSKLTIGSTVILLFIQGGSAWSSEKIADIFFDSRALARRLGHLNEFSGKQINENDLKSYRQKLCRTYRDYDSFPTEEIRVYCEEGSIRSPLRSTRVSQSKAQTRKSDPHTECLDARDYEGCIRARSAANGRDSRSDKCMDGVCRVTTKGNDAYGLPKPMGWLYLQVPDGRLFYFTKVYRVPHRGQNDRYIGMQRITRYYRSPRAGTSGTFIGGTTFDSTCSDYGSRISCQTTGYSPTYIPGRQAQPGGISSNHFYTVYDCKDKTSAAYQHGKIYVGWSKDNGGSFFANLLRKQCDRGTQYIRSLEAMYVQM